MHKYSTGYIGPIGSGNYVKMIHNGIEYGDMQLIAEVYDILRKIVGMTNEDMSRQFARWNDGALSSYLIEITAKIVNKADDHTGKGYVVDYVSNFHAFHIVCIFCFYSVFLGGSTKNCS